MRQHPPPPALTAEQADLLMEARFGRIFAPGDTERVVRSLEGSGLVVDLVVRPCGDWLDARITRTGLRALHFHAVAKGTIQDLAALIAAEVKDRRNQPELLQGLACVYDFAYVGVSPKQSAERFGVTVHRMAGLGRKALLTLKHRDARYEWISVPWWNPVDIGQWLPLPPPSCPLPDISLAFTAITDEAQRGELGALQKQVKKLGAKVARLEVEKTDLRARLRRVLDAAKRVGDGL